MSDAPHAMTSHRPYLLRALYEWIADNGMTPHVLVDATQPGVRVPPHAVKDGRVVLNIAERAVAQAGTGQRQHPLHRALRRRQPGGGGADCRGAGDLRARNRAGHGAARGHRRQRRRPGCGAASDPPEDDDPRHRRRGAARTCAWSSNRRHCRSGFSREPCESQRERGRRDPRIAIAQEWLPLSRTASYADALPSVQVHDARRVDRPAEVDQFVAAQHQPADMAVVAAFRILEAEAALETQPAIRRRGTGAGRSRARSGPATARSPHGRRCGRRPRRVRPRRARNSRARSRWRRRSSGSAG